MTVIKRKTAQSDETDVVITRKPSQADGTQARPEQEHHGPPSSYNYKLTPKMVYRMALLGLTEKQMASIFGLSERGFDNWKQKHPPVVRALMKGKLKADGRVVESMYRAACGYSHPDTHFVSGKVKDSDGNEELLVKQIPIIKHYPPSVGAATLWLSNRHGKIWHERIRAEITGPGGKAIPFRLDLSGYSDDELKTIEKFSSALRASMESEQENES
jgi:hypothetical protein